MIRLAAKILVNAVALWVADRLLDGIVIEDGAVSLAIVALIFGAVNAILKPLAIFLSFPALILTLGLFTIVVNGAMLAVTDWLSDRLSIDQFSTAMWAALIISLVSWALSSFVPDEDKKQDPQDSGSA